MGRGRACLVLKGNEYQIHPRFVKAISQSLKSLDLDITIFKTDDAPSYGFGSIYRRARWLLAKLNEIEDDQSPNLYLILAPLNLVPNRIANKSIAYINNIHERDHYLNKKRSPYYWLYSYLLYTRGIQHVKLVLTNSIYSKTIMEDIVRGDIRELYIPTRIYDKNLDTKREDWVCFLGRIHPSKLFEEILQVSTLIPDIQFHLIGRVLEGDEAYYKSLRNIGGPNVHWHINASEVEKDRVLFTSKVFLDRMCTGGITTSFPTAVSAGLLPVCHVSSPHHIEGFSYGKSWETPEDAATLIRSAMKDWSVELCQKQRERFRELYSQEKLERDLVSVIREGGFIDG